MEKCPTEILHYIFIKVPFEDRLECMCVCHHWYNIIDKHSLLYDVSVSALRYSDFREMIECLPYRATQVEKLKLFECSNSDFDNRMFCNMFPNLREIEISQSDYEEENYNYIGTEFHFVHPISKLEKIHDSCEFELTLQLVSSNLCDRLKSLTLACGNFSDSSNVITQLKNIQNLEELKLQLIKINLLDFEVMHSNLPSIKQLEIETGDLVSSEMPSNIKPAALLTKLVLEIDTTENLFTHSQWYRYMSKKYPNINDFNYSDLVLSGLSLYDVKEVFDKGIFPFLQVVGPHLDHFNFDNFCDFMNAFDKLDEFDCKLKKLSIRSNDNETVFARELAQSNQSKYIQELFLYGIFPEPINTLTDMIALETLVVNCTDYIEYQGYTNSSNSSEDGEVDMMALDFSQLIEACPPTLSTLSLTSVYIKVNTLSSNATFITDLKLSNIELTQELAKAISTCFPRLSKLYFHGELKRDVTISLLKHNLDDVSITTLYEEFKHAFSIQTINDNKTQYQALRSVQIQNRSVYANTYSTVVSISKEELQESILLKFICASVKKWKFHSQEKKYIYY